MVAIQGRPSPFFDPGSCSTADSLAVLHIKRDLLLPTTLSEHDEEGKGYEEGRVTNTRFGSFPHSTLIGLPWGSQVRASNVDTGSRGRTLKGKKRKRGQDGVDSPSQDPEQDSKSSAPSKTPVAASTGFIHLLPPTPELWTSSLPHRTQVVYTPDYSYILHRLRARPGSVIIEAGAGSGSFSHAAARAVFNGYPLGHDGPEGARTAEGKLPGKVLSFEFHQQRVETLKTEIEEHGLGSIIDITHRDVCKDGFVKSIDKDAEGVSGSQKAEAIFLDLPAPWLALPHLSRRPTPATSPKPSDDAPPEAPSIVQRLSPLNPDTAIRICTFSPCIEQVQRTITTLRQLGWTDIDMVEISQRRLEIRRERVGLQEEGVRGANSSAATVEEALGRLKEVEGKFKLFHEESEQNPSSTGNNESKHISIAEDNADKSQRPIDVPEGRSSKAVDATVDRKLYKEGRLIHRAEPELKTHTSYLVFAILPRDWTEEDEERARLTWPVQDEIDGVADGGEISGKKSKKKRMAASKVQVLPIQAIKKEPADVKAGAVVEGAAEDGVADASADVSNDVPAM
ncbi:MAG: hypothetical protein M4579_002210 [Chaenotheca gracillima]|nr:MAG: hypothetical protein M4579_002210 [Chaenotheca gracillima]